MNADSNSKFQHIVITGASSGIGEALSLYYARKGVRLGLTGRNPERLDNVAEACRARGAEAAQAILCVTDREALREWLLGLDEAWPIDLLIANAGVSAGMGDSQDEDPGQVRHLFAVNVTGVLNSIEPLLPRMVERGQGHIALMSSIAGFRGWPGAPAYSATKAAVRSYGEGLRGALAPSGVRVHVICPGFVKSRMTDANDFPMPFIMPAEKAARIIARGIEQNKGRIAFPFIPYFFVWLLMILPDGLAGALLRRTPAKRRMDGG